MMSGSKNFPKRPSGQKLFMFGGVAFAVAFVFAGVFWAAVMTALIYWYVSPPLFVVWLASIYLIPIALDALFPRRSDEMEEPRKTNNLHGTAVVLVGFALGLGTRHLVQTVVGAH